MRNLKLVSVFASLALLVVCFGHMAFDLVDRTMTPAPSVAVMPYRRCEMDCDTYFTCVSVDPQPSTCTMIDISPFD